MSITDAYSLSVDGLYSYRRRECLMIKKLSDWVGAMLIVVGAAFCAASTLSAILPAALANEWAPAIEDCKVGKTSCLNASCAEACPDINVKPSCPCTP